LALRHRRQAVHGVGDEGSRMGALVVEGEAAGVGQGQRVQVVDEASEELGLLQQRGEVALVAGVDAVHLGLDAGLEHGQRGSQLVGDVGQEPPALLLGDGQPGRHVVEGGRQGTDSRGPPGSTRTS